ncbi:MAG: hypothetical protein MI723_14950 [Caulobacterales bacterium]|nr:hypothetical protein [Caulobacterales bacterium]
MPLIALALLAAPTPALAQLLDVRAELDGPRAQVTMEFASPPAQVVAAPIAAGFVVQAVGVTAAPRFFETAHGRLVEAIDVRPGEGSTVVAARTGREVLTARARVTGTSAVIDLYLADAPAGGAVRAAVRSPAAADHGGPAKTRVKAARTPAPADDAAHGEGHDDAPASDHGDAESADPHEGGEEEAPAPRRVEVPEEARALVELYAGATDDETCTTLDAQVREDPWNFELVGRHGACLAVDGRVDEAQEVYARLLTFAPDDPDAHLGLGVTMAVEGDETAARLHFEDALNASQSDAQAGRARAFLAALDSH